MNSRILRIVLGLLAYCVASPSAPGAVTHRWSFSETSGTNLFDSIGTAHGSIWIIGTNTDYTLSGGAFRMSGGTRAQVDYAQFPAGLVSSLTNVTIEVWATPRAAQNWSRIFDFGSGSGVTANDFYLSFCRGANLNQQRLEYDPAPRWRIDTGLATTVSNQYHYVATWSASGGPNGGGLARWYRDGVLSGSTDTGQWAVSNVNDSVLWLGRSQFSADASASADYNELRIYSHAMSPTEIFVSRTNGPDTIVIPPAQASTLTLSTNLSLRLVANWTRGAGNPSTLVVLSAGQPPVFEPTNGVAYAANSVFGAGLNLGSSNFVVYAGTAASVTITNLLPGSMYYAKAFSYTASGGSSTTIYNLAEPAATNALMPGTVQSIQLVVPANIPLGSTGQATVRANYGFGVTNDVTLLSTITSSAPAVVSVSAGGVLQGNTIGSAWITAGFQSQVSSNMVAVVDPLIASIRHRYIFATDASDYIGTAHGTLEGGATVAGNQLVLNGASAFVNLPNNLVTGFTSITIEAWVTDNGSGNWSRIFDFGNNSAGEDQQGTGTQYMFLSLPSGGGILRAAFTTNSNGGEQLCDWVGNRPAVGVKSHIVLTLDDPSNVARLYVNGVQVGVNSNLTLTPAALGPTVNNWLGKSVWVNDSYFNGVVDEFRIYNTSLASNIVAANFVNGPDALGLPPPITVADAATLNPGAKVSLPVLANDTGAIAPATVQVVSPPVNGTAVVKPDGKILYTHNGSATTFDTFTYRVQNFVGSNSAPATVSLTVTNALRLAASTLALPPAAPPVTYQFVDAFPGLVFEDALAIATPRGRTNQIFVAERRGRISYVPDVNAVAPQRQVLVDITDQVFFDNSAEGESGLLGMAFHPGFETNGFFYVFYTAPGSPYFERLARFTANPLTLTVNTNSQLLLFSVVDQGDPCNCINNHNGGDLHFGPDGYLYIGTGDEGGQYNARQNAQRIDKDLFSALLRIDVDKRPGSIEPKPGGTNTTTIYTNGSGQAYYSIPPSNPFVNVTSYLGSPVNTNNLRAEMFATGFRHIWRFSIDQPTGDIWVGDVGQDWIEEINIVTNGGNYGWSYHEGLSNAVALYPTQPTLLSNPPPSFVHAPPFYSYLHTARAGGDPQFKGNSVTGGVLYRGNRIPELTGAYIFGDFESTHVWALWRTNNTVAAIQRIAGVNAPAGFGLDPSNGDVLIANYVANRIERLIRTDADPSFPQKLSDTGAFADLTDLAPNPGIVSYEPIVPFWSDHAIKRRWSSIPNLVDTITHVTDGNWTLPTGMVWVKHFDMETTRGNPATKQRLETRFIVKTTNSIYGVSYAWNPTGTEAYLVADGGTNFNLTVTNGLTTITQQWDIPSRSQCLACHTEVGGLALSFNTRQLNQSASMNGFAGNQIALLSDAGYFVNPVAAPQTLPAFSKASDASVSLEQRVRSYLSVNCVQCHQSGGAGPTTWDARAWLSLDDTRLINGQPDNNAGIPANKLIVPGDVAHSVVLQRIRANGFSRMPPLATSVIDDAATNLLHLWISTELTNRQSFAQWQLAIFGSTNAANALAAADPDGDGANNYYEYLTQTSPTNAVPAPWTIAIDEASGTVGVSFQRIANLGFLVETSTDFANWNIWDVPDNTLWFSASNFVDSINGPLAGGTNQFFRVKLVEP